METVSLILTNNIFFFTQDNNLKLKQNTVGFNEGVHLLFCPRKLK